MLKHIMTLDEVRRDGVLLEVNRQLLHPRGLALTAVVSDEAVTPLNLTDDGVAALCELVTKAMDAEIISEANAAALSARLQEARRIEAGDIVTLYVQEDDDPEGWRFGEFDAFDKVAARQFQARLEATAPARGDALGYSIEPLE